MVKREIIFGACAAATPDFAAKLAQIATELSSEITLEQGDACLSVDSLISILALDLRRGARVTVCANGADESTALDRISALLVGRAAVPPSPCCRD